MASKGPLMVSAHQRHPPSADLPLGGGRCNSIVGFGVESSLGRCGSPDALKTWLGGVFERTFRFARPVAVPRSWRGLSQVVELRSELELPGACFRHSSGVGVPSGHFG